MNGVTRNVTGLGVAVICIALVLALAGLFSRDGALMTLGFGGLLLAGACFFLAPLNLRDLELRVRAPRRFHATRSVGIEAELFNGRRILDAYHVQITMRFPQRVEHGGYADWTPAGSVSLLSGRLSIPVRANASEVGCEFFSAFPLGLFEARRTVSVSCPMLVYPRLITPLELLVDGSQPDLMPMAGVAAGNAFGEPRGIRPYQPGDRANQIHQPATARSLARGHGLRVRAYDPPGFHPQCCRIVYHSFAEVGELIRFDRFERGLSLVAGTLAYFQSIYTKVTLQAEFTDWLRRPCENRTQYFECLALLAEIGRPVRTEAGQLAKILQGVPIDERLIVISDSPPENWAELIPTARKEAIVVDIRQIRFKRRQYHVVES